VGAKKGKRDEHQSYLVMVDSNNNDNKGMRMKIMKNEM
jgi:hypothetical protein